MKRNCIAGRLLALLLVLTMVLPMMPLQASAYDTGIADDAINYNSVISLPVQIMDYEADGMLFEYAEAYPAQSASDFDATWGVNLADLNDYASLGGYDSEYFYAGYSKTDFLSNDYAGWTRFTWNKNCTDAWASGHAPFCIAYSNGSNIIASKASEMRYMVVVYRSNAADPQLRVGLTHYTHFGAGTANEKAGYYTDYYSLPKTTVENGVYYWDYAVLDLKTGNLAGHWDEGLIGGMYFSLPLTGAGQWFDLAHVAVFDNAVQAERFGKYAITDGSARGNNRAFGLLMDSQWEDGSKIEYQERISNYLNNVLFQDVNAPRNMESYTDANGRNITEILGYLLAGNFSGIATMGLLESSLSADGYPVYKPEVVVYLAQLLRQTLEIPLRTEDGWVNYRSIRGTASPVYGGTDLATALRSRITAGDLGSYEATKAKVNQGQKLTGTWAQCQGNIKTYHDAAYFLLNSIFIPGSYNEPQDDYDHLQLSLAYPPNDYGTEVHIFDGGFAYQSNPAISAVNYDKQNKTIINTGDYANGSFLVSKPDFLYDGQHKTTRHPLLPITDKNNAAGQTQTYYYQDDGTRTVQEGYDTLTNRNYGYAMVTEGEFVYRRADNLFFEFEGDDDVYLFINGELVLDIGSAHGIDYYHIELNDYVDYANTSWVPMGTDARRAALQLEEGETYSFKFYYLERHSYGANMRINTNIKVKDPRMTTDKLGWQNGQTLEDYSVIDPDHIIEYGFRMNNVGRENLYNLSFADHDIGVTLSCQEGLKVTGGATDLDGDTLEVNDLIATVSVAGQPDRRVTFADNAALIRFLKNPAGNGLPIGGRVTIRGIGYQLTDEQAGAGSFDNTVIGTCTDGRGKTLKDDDTLQLYIPSDPMYYQWAGHDLVVSKTKFIGDVMAAANKEGNILEGKAPNLQADRVNNIVVYNDAVTVNSDLSMTINYTHPGSFLFYAHVIYNNSQNRLFVPVLVNVTEAKDSVYVLDYGLKADLTSLNNSGVSELIKNDAVTVPARDTGWSILGIGSNGAYTPNEITFTKDGDGQIVSGSGTYQLTNQTLTYTPGDFMDTQDTIQLAVNVYEKNFTPSNITGKLDINNEVEMYKNITVLPATVVYYEDDFPAITYCQSEKNVFEKVGSSSGNSQGVDQDENYGHDGSYAADDKMSGDSLHTITIREDGPVAKFTFKGTGFELISRTNAYDSATLEIAVFRGDVKVSYTEDKAYKDDKGNAPIRMIPVITEFDNGANLGAEEIYQVPVVRVDDLEQGVYTVVIGGIPAYDWSQSIYPDHMVIKPTSLYIDGLRIFQPMGATNEHYSSDENGAVFTELRDMIVGGQAAVATYTGTSVNVSSGTTTWTENRNGMDTQYTGNIVNSVNDYLIQGPNNEVYMDGAFTDTALAFQVAETGTGTHALQVAIHAVDQSLFLGTGEDGMHAPVYYATAAGVWEPLATITSGTEQYYTIDYTKCPVENGAYQIILKVDIGKDHNTAMASYTTVKTVGLNIVSMNTEAATYRYNNGVMEVWDGEKWIAAAEENGTNGALPAFELLGRMLSTGVMAAPEQPELPEPIEPANPFADVQEGSFYFDAMLWAVENGITNGTSATTFSPDKLVSRAETVTFLWRAAGEPEPATVKNPFVDVKESDFFYKAVLWAVENGITNGMDATHFGPLSICNRAQVVTFLWRAAGEPVPGTTENPFRDVAEGDFYCDAVLWAIENSITNGIDAVSFGPTASCNRAQIVTFLYRAQ